MRDDDPSARSTACVDACEPCDDCCECPSQVAEKRQRLRRWAWVLVAFAIGWNSIEAVVAIFSGLAARSIALVAFGLDSVIEVSSSLVMVWRFSRRSVDEEASEQAERRAVRLIALIFFALAVYVTFTSVSTLLGFGDEPDPSPVGLVLLVLSLVIMPQIYRKERQVAAAMGSVAFQADAAQLRLCILLSGVTVIGLAGNALLGWWWLDPAAALVIAGLAIKEGREAWARGELCESETFVIGRRAGFPCAPVCCPTCPAV
ncbi:MAG: hypothetical protein GEU73_12990 [Chloroflexi bacterium]|nr:hypothetical protein [Chloroflexota bacterium]